ncbi:cation:proton antiporter [Ramlibacter sp. AN1133]|uniref:cation:proton antiporter n=1 Tax=Ramlibacter sp. AN1133 TaxID=3133429 RepID=UPI0030C401DC
MHEFEQILALFVAAVLLAAAARRVGAPYPVFLAIGGALLAFVPGVPHPSLPPDLVLALFVAPVLLDAAFDASLRDLRDNWAPVTGLVVFAVGLTTAAVAVVAHALVPGLPWAAAIALGAIVAPPDAVAATAVLRPLQPPQRLLTILEGESLLNDASALLIYRLAVGAVAAGSFSLEAVAPTFLLAVGGSIVAGPALGWLAQRLLERVQHIPTAIILQFITTFGVWLVAERAGLSGVLTTVCYAMTLARSAPARIPARVRIPTNAVWATVIFALNIFAFIFIGLQIRPIVAELEAPVLRQYLVVAAAVLATVILVRIAWHMAFNAVLRWKDSRFGFHPPRPMLRPTVGSGLLISWAGMRGIVTLAAALALPDGFPARNLILLTAFSVVLGTLLVQGLTLKALLRALDLRDGDPIAQEVGIARERALEAALAQLPRGRSSVIDLVRKDFKVRLGNVLQAPAAPPASASEYEAAYGAALASARQALLAVRASGEIGDDAFHSLESELDWLEVSDPLRSANADETSDPHEPG